MKLLLRITIGVILLAVAAARAEEAKKEQPKKAPEDIQRMVERLIAASNAGEWGALASSCNVPFLVGNSVYADHDSLLQRLRENCEGSTRKILSVEAADEKTLKPNLGKESREFIADGDQLIRLRYESRGNGKVENTKSLLVFRKVQDQLLLTGTVWDPDKQK